MAINPNTDFTAGAILTAAQQNRFPRGVMAYNAVTATDATVTAEEVQITSSSFTAVANRYYKITYFEPGMSVNTANVVFTLRIRQGTTTAGTQLASSSSVNTSGSIFNGTVGICYAVTTFAAAATQVCATLACSAGTASASRSASQPAFILVEDIGPA